MTPEAVQHVAVSGISWTTILVGLLNLLVGGALVSWIRNRPKMREIEQDATAKLIDTLSTRVDKLEEELSSQRTHYEAKIERLQATYDATQRIARHELANVKMRFRSLVMLLKRLPNQSKELIDILADIEAMEAEQAKAEAAEKGAQSGVRIVAATGVIP